MDSVHDMIHACYASHILASFQPNATLANTIPCVDTCRALLYVSDLESSNVCSHQTYNLDALPDQTTPLG
jgi:hypothetical protein